MISRSITTVAALVTSAALGVAAFVPSGAASAASNTGDTQTMSVSSTQPDSQKGQGFASAPELGTFQEYLSRDPKENLKRINNLPAERAAKFWQEVERGPSLPSAPTAPLGFAGGLDAAPATSSSDRQLADDLVFGGSLDRFVQYRAYKYPDHPQFNWTTDLCSTGWARIATKAWETPFQNACLRHDFGYGNYSARSELKLDPSKESRKRIDRKFYEDMRDISNRSEGIARRILLSGAHAFYGAVRQCGGQPWGLTRVYCRYVG